MYVNLITGEQASQFPNPLWQNGTRFDNPTAQMCRVAGWREVEGEDAVPVGKVATAWSWTDLDGERAYRTAVVEDAPPPAPMRLDKIKLKRAIRAINPALWDGINAYIAADASREEDWHLTPYVMEDDPVFVECLPTITAMLPEGTDVSALLASCQMEGPL